MLRGAEVRSAIHPTPTGTRASRAGLGVRMRTGGYFTDPYNFILVDHCVTGRDDSTYPQFLHRLCFVSKYIKKETFGVSIRICRFQLRSIATNNFLRALLTSVENGAQISELHVGLFDQFSNFSNGTRNPTN